MKTEETNMETDLQDLAREHTKAALAVLAEIMANADAPPSVRLSAAKAMLERGWGKPTAQKREEPADERPAPVMHIVRTIVDPKEGEPPPESSREPYDPELYRYICPAPPGWDG
jgi:hypothetical protein